LGISEVFCGAVGQMLPGGWIHTPTDSIAEGELFEKKFHAKSG
jgi:hypothetical protein